jgi:hypothetical protein
MYYRLPIANSWTATERQFISLPHCNKKPQAVLGAPRKISLPFARPGGSAPQEEGGFKGSRCMVYRGGSGPGSPRSLIFTVCCETAIL